MSEGCLNLITFQKVMSNYKDKIQFFIFGLMLGLLVGMGFFILKLDDYFSELNFYKRINQSQQDTLINQHLNKVVVAENSYKKKYKLPQPLKQSDSLLLSQSDSSFGSDFEKELRRSGNRSVEKLSADSLRNDTIEKNHLLENPENIIVMKDEFLSAKMIDLNSINGEQGGVVNSKDSLLEQVSGVKDYALKNAYRMEFWKSPINYKGYKMIKNKIVLYGIDPLDVIKLYKVENEMFLKCRQTIYQLQYANDFSPFERVMDEGILAKLK